MSDESRRKPRRRIADAIVVSDTMTGRVVGRIGNLSETGMLLVADREMHDDALYQFRFSLVDAGGSRTDCEVGAHLLWKEPHGGSGLFWTGFRFLAVSEAQAARLRAWIAQDAAESEA